MTDYMQDRLDAIYKVLLYGSSPTLGTWNADRAEEPTMSETSKVILKKSTGSQSVHELRVNSSDTRINVDGVIYTWDGQSINRAGWPVYEEVRPSAVTVDDTIYFNEVPQHPSAGMGITEAIHRRLTEHAVAVGTNPIGGLTPKHILVSPDDFEELTGYSISSWEFDDYIYHYHNWRFPVVPDLSTRPGEVQIVI